MGINVIEIPGKDRKDMLQRRTVINFHDEELIMEVEGFGTAEGRFKVITTGKDESFEPMAVIRDALGIEGEPDTEGYYDLYPSLGRGIALVEPITFAYVIRDIIHNS